MFTLHQGFLIDCIQCGGDGGDGQVRLVILLMAVKGLVCRARCCLECFAECLYMVCMLWTFMLTQWLEDVQYKLGVCG